MNTRRNPLDLARMVARRSPFRHQIGAVIADSWGVFSWGWAHSLVKTEGKGESVHAEVHAITRANPRRLQGATIYVAGRRRKNGKEILAKPCGDCAARLVAAGVERIIYTEAK